MEACQHYSKLMMEDFVMPQVSSTNWNMTIFGTDAVNFGEKDENKENKESEEAVENLKIDEKKEKNPSKNKKKRINILNATIQRHNHIRWRPRRKSEFEDK
jgi:hypothetical protein